MGAWRARLCHGIHGCMSIRLPTNQPGDMALMCLTSTPAALVQFNQFQGCKSGPGASQGIESPSAALGTAPECTPLLPTHHQQGSAQFSVPISTSVSVPCVHATFQVPPASSASSGARKGRRSRGSSCTARRTTSAASCFRPALNTTEGFVCICRLRVARQPR